MSGIKIVTDWTASAVATSDQKSFMRVDFSDDDSLIAELIKCPVSGFLGSDHREIAEEGKERISSFRYR